MFKEKAEQTNLNLAIVADVAFSSSATHSRRNILMMMNIVMII